MGLCCRETRSRVSIGAQLNPEPVEGTGTLPRLTVKNGVIRRGISPNDAARKLGRQESNLGMTGSKPVALPLGDAPKSVLYG